ncbi:hypothetical protein TI04_10025 [Achromatium sp. WMS2]|nr:hypothetical protein TI04_10025 [Achromatium sp. WMS2]
MILIRYKRFFTIIFYHNIGMRNHGYAESRISFMREGDLIVRKIKDPANKQACMVTYVSTNGTSSNIFCFEEQ